MPKNFERQISEIQDRVAALNRQTAFSIPNTEPAAEVRLGRGEARPSDDLCNKAAQTDRYQVSLCNEEAALKPSMPKFC
jgi:hypothetical protein